MKEKMIEDNWWYPDFLKAGEAPQQPNHTLSIQMQHDGISPPLPGKVLQILHSDCRSFQTTEDLSGTKKISWHVLTEWHHSAKWSLNIQAKLGLPTQSTSIWQPGNETE